MNHPQALEIVKKYVKNPNLIKHMLAVEAAMGAYSQKFGEDEEKWRIAGLLHDFDWEIHPTLEAHPQKGSEILRTAGVDEDTIHTILSHAPHTGVPRIKPIEKALFACDEITGLIVATTLVQPTRKLADVSVGSIKKKFNSKGFAAGVNREEVEQAAQELGVDLWEEHVPTVLQAMQHISPELGL